MGIFVWGGFIALILGLLALDLGVFHRKAHAPTVGEALAWSAFWIFLAMAFIGVVYFLYENNWIGAGLAFPEDVSGREASLEFLTGYVLEKSLSLDNIFVIALIFSYFRIPLEYQHRVLFWGVLGALVMRGVMIGAGSVLIARFAWTTYVFGGILLLTAARMLVVSHDNLEPERSPLIRLARRLYPVTDGLRGDHFFVKDGGRWAMTPMALVLLMVEGTDLLFAVDSIPAIFAVTHDPFLVYTSNVFAILGLRSLYFALAPLLAWFRFLKSSLVFVLAFVGVKMLLAHHHSVPVAISLPVILGLLSVGVVASVLFPREDPAMLRSPMESDMEHFFRMSRTAAVRSGALFGGGALLAMGTLLFMVPAVGVHLFLLGLAVLASQFVWARGLLARAEARFRPRSDGGREPNDASGG